MTPVSKPTIYNFLFGCGIDPSIAPIQLPDDRYMLPAKSWIAGEFAEALQWDQEKLGLSRYVYSKNNCNKFARHAKDFADRCHLATESPDDTALAFGEFWYVTDAGPGHCINCAVCRENAELELVFFEPQSCRLVNLSKKEISLCSGARF